MRRLGLTEARRIATADRDAGVLRVDAIYEDVPFSSAMRAGIEGELDALARWLGLDRTR